MSDRTIDPISGAMEWPYPIEYDRTDEIDTDVLVIGGGASGCFAAMGAASRGARVVMMEKAATLTSGAMGSGCDHWEMAATNPCSQGHARGAGRRDDPRPPRLQQRHLPLHRGPRGLRPAARPRALRRRRSATPTTSSWAPTSATTRPSSCSRTTTRTASPCGCGAPPSRRAMYRGAKQMKAQVMDRTMGAGLLTEGGRMGARVVGAVAIDGRTGRFTVCRAKATVFCMSRPTRLWLFAPGATGISEFRPPAVHGRRPRHGLAGGRVVHHAREVAAGPSGRGCAASRPTAPATTTTPGTPARWSTRKGA